MTLLAPQPTRPIRLTPVPWTAHRTDRPLVAWAERLEGSVFEPRRSRTVARVGGVVATLSMVAYLTWRIGATLPPAGPWLVAAWLLVAFEALPLIGSTLKVFAWWTVDAPTRPPVSEVPNGMRLAVLIPTYDEPSEVVGPTVAAARALQPAHETWVLDDGDRPWLKDMCRALDVRYVTRAEPEHAKAGNLNNALSVMAREEADGAARIDLVAVLDCDHVPLTGFLTATLGYFEDEGIALVQAPQAYFNVGAFDDDGYTGEQGLFFNVALAARAHAGAGSFWCGSTAVLRVAALRDVGGVAQETVVEDMHTTLKLQRRGWRTAYHHQTVAVGLAPATPDQYLVQRRRWGMGAMQVLILEKLWRRHRWMSWRSQYEYLAGTLWWLEGLATILAFLVPVGLLVSGAATSTVPPSQFAAVFATAFVVRMWGYKRLMRNQIRWRTAFALRVLRIPVGLSCVWWLVSRRTLRFKVTPKGAFESRRRGRIPNVILALMFGSVGVVVYAAFGLAGDVPWRTDTSSTMSSGVWLVVAAGVLFFAAWRITAEPYATSRRAAYRVPVQATVRVDGLAAELVDVSVNGAAVRFAPGDHVPAAGRVTLELPGTGPASMNLTRPSPRSNQATVVTLTVPTGNWESLRTLALWMFHTPAGGVAQLPAGVPVVALRPG